MILLLCLLSLEASAAVETLRLDYFHTGNAREEIFSLDGLVVEGPWPGGTSRRLDETNLGKYRFEVLDLLTQRLLYSRGFASIYGEWETTAEARQRHRTFHESIRFPFPDGRVQVVFKKRDRENSFREIWSLLVDPSDSRIDRTPILQRGAGPDVSDLGGPVWMVLEGGPPAEKIDLLLIGDGYGSAEMKQWRADARALTERLFEVSPFQEHRNRFNVWAVDVISSEPGIRRPSDQVHRRSALRCRYDAFGSERYVLTFDNKLLREAAAQVPYEFVVILVNEEKYGGGGIYNLYATVAARNAWAPYLMVHEFGHHFAGLADEYYTSSVAYESATDRPEPWEPNVTADPKGGRWAHLIEPGIPLPTPWPKRAFEAVQGKLQQRRERLREEDLPEAEVEALFRQERSAMDRMLSSALHAGKTGAFEGAMYHADGYYRSRMDCIMFTRNEAGFCPVCREAILKVMDLYSGAQLEK